MTMTRRSLFGLVLAPLVPLPAPARSFLKSGHVTADPCLLVDLEMAREYAARMNDLQRVDFRAHEVLMTVPTRWVRNNGCP